MGQSDHLSPAVFNILEDIPVMVLNASTLYTSLHSPEEALVNLFKEASQSTPSIVYVPKIGQLFETATDSLRTLFLSSIQSLAHDLNVFLLCTAERQPCKSHINLY